jgi:hypothetical protein
MRKPRIVLTPEQRAALISDYVGGLRRSALARKYGISQPTASDILAKTGTAIRGEEKRKRHVCDESAFDVIGEASAYWAGLLMADGDVRFRSPTAAYVRVRLTANDREHVEQFRQFLGTSVPATFERKKPHDGYQSRATCGVVVCSLRLATALGRLGVVQNKTMAACASEMVTGNRHFWRGVVDGDGSMGAYPTGHSNLYPALSLVGARPLVGQFLEFAKTVSPGCAATVRPHRSIWGVSLVGSHGYRLIAHLYGDCSVALKRKALLAGQIVEQFSSRYAVGVA